MILVDPFKNFYGYGPVNRSRDPIPVPRPLKKFKGSAKFTHRHHISVTWRALRLHVTLTTLKDSFSNGFQRKRVIAKDPKFMSVRCELLSLCKTLYVTIR